MIALDYRDCGPEGEPRVVHVDQARDYAVTFLAEDFARFVGGLCCRSECTVGGSFCWPGALECQPVRGR
jgi:hypothetical protein